MMNPNPSLLHLNHQTNVQVLILSPIMYPVNKFFSAHTKFLIVLNVSTEPSRFSEALTHSHWCDAM